MHLPQSSITHQRACLHALHAHKLPELGGGSPCLSANMSRGAPNRPSRARLTARGRRASSPRSGPHPTTSRWLRRLPTRLPAARPPRLPRPPTTVHSAFAQRMRELGSLYRVVITSTSLLGNAVGVKEHAHKLVGAVVHNPYHALSVLVFRSRSALRTRGARFAAYSKTSLSLSVASHASCSSGSSGSRLGSHTVREMPHVSR